MSDQTVRLHGIKEEVYNEGTHLVVRIMHASDRFRSTDVA